MQANLLRKEILSHVLGGRFVFSVSVALALMLSSTFVLVRDHEEQLRAWAAFSAEHARQVGSYETGADSPLDALAMGGRVVDLRPPALAFLASGTSRSLPRSFWLSQYDGPAPETNLVANRIQDLFGVVDWRFVIGLVFSLLALVLSYDAINGERAAGTLRAILANPVSLRALLLAKWLGISAVLGAAFLLAVLLSLLIALFHPLVHLGADDVARLVLMLLLSLLYLAVFVSLGLLLSCLFDQPASSIAVGLLVWVAAVLVVPGAAAQLAPAGLDTGGYVSAAVRRQDDLGYDFRAIYKRFLDEGRPRAEAARLAGEVWRDEVEPRRAANVGDANQAFLNEKAQVVARGRALARLSPYGSFSFALTELAGTGLDEQLRFERALEHYRREFRDFIRARQAAGGGPEVRPEEVPAFHYQPASLAAAAAGAFIDAGLLAFGSLLLFSLTYLRMLRYDVR